MKTPSLGALAGLAVLVLAPSVAAQQVGINMDIGVNQAHPLPSTTYGAASGQTGTWNGVAGSVAIVGPVSLTDVNGNANAATLVSSGGAADFEFNNAGTTGDDDSLLDDLYDSSTSQYIVQGLADGNYDVYVYSWAPDNRTTFFSDVTIQGGSKGTQNVGGGSWAGSFVEGVHYAKDTVSINGGADLVWDIVTPAPITPTSLNGFQIVPAGCNGSPQTYCTAKAGLVCGVPMISSSGAPSAVASSGFVVSAAPAREQKSGLGIYGFNGRDNLPFQGGTLCFSPPVRRTVAVSSGGAGACTGVLSIDVNAFAQGLLGGNPAPELASAGALIHFQFWARDSLATGSLVSDAIEWTVCP